MAISQRAKNRNKKLVNELITLPEFLDDRLFIGRLKRFGLLDDFINAICTKYPSCATDGLEFCQWHDETEVYLDKYIEQEAAELWSKAENHCPELINPSSDPDYHDLAVILPEPYASERAKGYNWRISYYSRHGAKNHQVFKTFNEAVYECYSSGYTNYKPGTLDSLVGTHDWNRGLVVTKACKIGVWLNEYLEKFATSDELALFA
ncbi:hypothetical protein [Photobacterium leiognathi]|uniref:hypothetical protein n=1 Tax=Photobacterium leiognathi TaxID=553611 RepID=UPI0029823BB2|nr:hypothetical protein [Photobacterium leiognathi]